jgi:hypothetical protein
MDIAGQTSDGAPARVEVDAAKLGLGIGRVDVDSIAEGEV